MVKNAGQEIRTWLVTSRIDNRSRGGAKIVNIHEIGGVREGAAILAERNRTGAADSGAYGIIFR